MVEPLVVQVVVLTMTAQLIGSQVAVGEKKEMEVQLELAAVLAEVDQTEPMLEPVAHLCMAAAEVAVENKAQV
tara:strand:- start:493 stop:711 length:219 start_codon:yes stop_codon:yes gene_type:complete